MGKPVDKLDAIKTLGKILGPGHKRDAVHIAVIAAMATEELQPGQHIGHTTSVDWFDEVDLKMDLEMEGLLLASSSATPVAIVDPYLQHSVLRKQRFWAFMYPRTITSLRHVWTHPEFDDEPEEDAPPNQAAVAGAWGWIAGYARTELGVDHKELVRHATEFLDDGEYWTEGGRFEGMSVSDEFWDKYEIVTGRKVIDDRRGGVFSCSC